MSFLFGFRISRTTETKICNFDISKILTHFKDNERVLREKEKSGVLFLIVFFFIFVLVWSLVDQIAIDYYRRFIMFFFLLRSEIIILYSYNFSWNRHYSNTIP
jgi:hypothetical protein